MSLDSTAEKATLEGLASMLENMEDLPDEKSKSVADTIRNKTLNGDPIKPITNIYQSIVDLGETNRLELVKEIHEEYQRDPRLKLHLSDSPSSLNTYIQALESSVPFEIEEISGEPPKLESQGYQTDKTIEGFKSIKNYLEEDINPHFRTTSELEQTYKCIVFQTENPPKARYVESDRAVIIKPEDEQKAYQDLNEFEPIDVIVTDTYPDIDLGTVVDR